MPVTLYDMQDDTGIWSKFLYGTFKTSLKLKAYSYPSSRFFSTV